jgi:oxygen-independent coproporphyrinogen-3 oxidase
MAIGLYVHIPFCVKKCEYCSFVSYPAVKGARSRFIEALFMEINMRGRTLPPEEKAVDSVYIGGGTPTCLSGEALAAIMREIFACFSVSGTAEITVETNPGTADEEKYASLKRAGINRLSIGVQACHRDLLKTLGRLHSYSDAVKAFLDARSAGIDNISLDLIFGIPGQTFEQWHSCLETVAELRPEHISAYGLQLEEGTPLFNKVGEGILEPCPEDLEAEMYLDLIETLESYGYIHYEISNFSLPGYFCRHNLRYWRNLDYLSLGPSAHSYLKGRRFSNEPGLDRYVERLQAGDLPVCWEEETGPATEMSETAFVGLRLIEGLDTELFRKRFGKDIYDVYGKEIEHLTALKLIKTGGGRIYLTKRGILLGNLVFSEFV